jgi:hypothetical protein
MKKLFFISLLMLFLNASAQTDTDVPTDRSLSLELFGAHNTIGINYDSRFKGNDGFGFRVGLGYGYSEKSSFLIGSYRYNIHGISAPLEINYLFGKGRHHLELGFGASLGFYREKLHAQDVFIPYGNHSYGSYDITYKHSTFGYFMFGNIGYRLQTNRGFQLRVGLTPSINFNDKYCLQREWFYPYVSFGWRLK